MPHRHDIAVDEGFVPLRSPLPASGEIRRRAGRPGPHLLRTEQLHGRDLPGLLGDRLRRRQGRPDPRRRAGIFHVGAFAPGCKMRATDIQAGIWVWVDHGGGRVAKDNHLDAVVAKEGERVTPQTPALSHLADAGLHPLRVVEERRQRERCLELPGGTPVSPQRDVRSVGLHGRGTDRLLHQLPGTRRDCGVPGQGAGIEPGGQQQLVGSQQHPQAALGLARSAVYCDEPVLLQTH
jgi:hypothetical protein